ncbi:hypothetical protein KFL_007170030 [Klebsormidium nitens]|uniref:Uncharacterized protein n=1 Tax=Klebsormidium nitens TaxID=105231 RepID=A0A1Y1IQK3_KLENI|nr:hypothetical protein KFL_007170030 [Klebsormidium nitens]|eukprot:GAQ91036.1 hypothetical protein KFL_007170030 [Klebsormidium nitens]
MDPEASQWKADLHDFLSKPASSLVDTTPVAVDTRQTDSCLDVSRRPVDQRGSLRSQLNRLWFENSNTSSGVAIQGQSQKGHSKEKAVEEQATVRPVKLDHNAIALLQKAFRSWHGVAVYMRGERNGAHPSDVERPYVREDGPPNSTRISSIATDAAASGRPQRPQPIETEGMGRGNLETGPAQRVAQETPVGPWENLQGWVREAGQEAARRLVRGGVLQSLIQEAYRAGLEAGSTQRVQNPPTAHVDTEIPNSRKCKTELMASQAGGAGEETSIWRQEVVKGLEALERQVAASCARALEASKRLECSLEGATVVELAAIERLVEEKVWQTREECEQHKIAAMERTEHELAATKAALQASLAREGFEMGHREGARASGRGVAEEARGQSMQTDPNVKDLGTESTSHVASAAFSGDSWFMRDEVEMEVSESQPVGLSVAEDLPDMREDNLRFELERANEESVVLDRVAAQVAAWRVETNQERAQLESTNRMLHAEVRELRLRAEVERTAQKKAALSEAIQPCAEAQDSLSKVLQAVQALQTLSEKRPDTRSSRCEAMRFPIPCVVQALCT